MKRLLVLLLPALLLISACTAKDTPPGETPTESPGETPIETPAETPSETPVSLEDFQKLTETAMDPLELLPKLESLLKEGGEGDHDAAMMAYLQYLRTYSFMGVQDEYQQFDQLEPYFVYNEAEGSDVLQVEKIPAGELKDLYDRFAKMGYTFARVEGSVMPQIDFSFVDQHKEALSPGMIAYGVFKQLDSDRLWASDGGLRIPVKELGERVAQGEKLLQEHSADLLPAVKDDALRTFQNYFRVYLVGLVNTPVVSEGKIRPEVQTAYEDFLKNHPETESAKILARYYSELNGAGFAAPYEENSSESILRFRTRMEKLVQDVTGKFGTLKDPVTYGKTSVNLHLRTNPDLTSEVLYTIPAGTVVKIWMLYSGWVQVETAGWSGYSREEYLTPVTLGPQYRMTLQNLNLRESPSLTSPVLIVLPAQTLVELEKEEGEWGKTTYGGKTGYLFLEYLGTP